jgi:7-cyano-7-deazaguanine synthase
LFKARTDFEVVLALTFDYGQRAARQEIAHAREIAAGLKIPHDVVELPFFRSFTKTALVSTANIPSGPAVEIDNMERSKETAKAVWVPNRNGIFLNIAAGFAEGLGATVVVPGFNAEEAATFPDNSDEFLKVLDKSFHYSTANGVSTLCYSIDKSKTEIVREGIQLKIPFQQLWPCYLGGHAWCRQCESCQRSLRAFKANGLEI